ncbi:22735_t:CDS:2 [Gigaspora rosea]|nr:22735_t:CDS:2 [Gigaspora rosea]
MPSVPEPTSSSTSFLIEDTEDVECPDSEKEYILLLTFHRTSLENQDSDHSNEDYVEAGTSSACKRKHKSAENGALPVSCQRHKKDGALPVSRQRCKKNGAVPVSH